MDEKGEESFRKNVWKGAIPIRVELVPSEITTLQPPAPYYVMGPRQGYLPTLVDSLRSHFENALPPGDDAVWFDYKGLPLKWHIPIGVLYDLLCVNFQRPWPLTVHFRNYPRELLPCGGESDVVSNYMNSLKQAMYIMHGNVKLVVALSQAEQASLCQAVATGNGGAFETASFRLRSGPNGIRSSVPVSPAQTNVRKRETSTIVGDGVHENRSPITGAKGQQKPTKVPFRIYVRELEAGDLDPDSDGDRGFVSSWDELGTATRFFQIPQDSEIPCTLRDALRVMVPHLFPPTLGSNKPSELPSLVAPAAVEELRRPSVGDIDAALVTADSPTDGGNVVFGRSEEAVPSASQVGLPIHIDEGQDGHGGSREENLDADHPQLSEGSGRDISNNAFLQQASCSTEKLTGVNDPQVCQEERSKTVKAPKEEGCTDQSSLKDGPEGAQGEGTCSEVQLMGNGFACVQGIKLSLDTPVDWTGRNLCGPDLFVHTCIHILRSS